MSLMKKAAEIHFSEDFSGRSSTLNAAVYWTDQGGNKVLTVVFKGGQPYEYYDVPATVADHLTVKTPDFSPGKFVAANIKGMYRYAAVNYMPVLATADEVEAHNMSQVVTSGSPGVKEILESSLEALAADYLPGREASLVKTKIEEALLWLTKVELKP